MKRIIVTILSILYMAGATGATVHIHYCMGKLMGASLVHSDDDMCGKCGMKKKGQNNGCCKDEHKTFKNGDHHQLAKADYHFSAKAIPAPLPGISPDSYVAAHIQPPVITFRGHSPPYHWRSRPIYLLIRNFRV